MNWTPGGDPNDGETPVPGEMSRRARRLAEQAQAPEFAGADELAAAPESSAPNPWSDSDYVAPSLDGFAADVPPVTPLAEAPPTAAPSWGGPAAPAAPAAPEWGPPPTSPPAAAPSWDAPAPAAPPSWQPPAAAPQEPAPSWAQPAPTPAWEPPAPEPQNTNWEPPAPESQAPSAGQPALAAPSWEPPAPTAESPRPEQPAGSDETPGWEPPAPAAETPGWEPPAPAAEAPSWEQAAPPSAAPSWEQTAPPAETSNWEPPAAPAPPQLGDPEASTPAPPPTWEAPAAAAGSPAPDWAPPAPLAAAPTTPPVEPAGDIWVPEPSTTETPNIERPHTEQSSAEQPAPPAEVPPAIAVSGWPSAPSAEPRTPEPDDAIGGGLEALGLAGSDADEADAVEPVDTASPYFSAELPRLEPPAAEPVSARSDATAHLALRGDTGLVDDSGALPPGDDPVDPAVVGSGSPLVDFGDLAKPRPAEWISFALAFVLPPVGFVAGIVMAALSARRRGWTIVLDKATIVIGLIMTGVAAVGGVVAYGAWTDAREFEATVAGSAEFCAQVQADPTYLEPPIYSWPQRGFSIDSSLDEMQVWVDRWTAAAEVAPTEIQAGVANLAETGQGIVDNVAIARQIDNDQNVETISAAVSASGIDEWVETYCVPAG